MNVRIREMQQEDWRRVKEIYLQGIEEGKSTFQTSCPEYEEWDQNHISECRFVVECDGKVDGWAVLSKSSSRCVYRGVAEISIYIDRDVRNHGVGSMLLKHMCKESEKKGYWSLYSVIFSINEASIQMHKNCGFRVVGYREKIAKDRFGYWQNTTMMERRSELE